MKPEYPEELLRLTVRAKPNSRVESITWAGEVDGLPLLEVKVRAKAVDGAANDAIVATVASWLDLPRSAVTIVRGATSRVKHVHIDGRSDTTSRLADLRRQANT